MSESNCCGAPPENEVNDEIAICSKCKEWAEFEDEEDE